MAKIRCRRGSSSLQGFLRTSRLVTAVNGEQCLPTMCEKRHSSAIHGKQGYAKARQKGERIFQSRGVEEAAADEEMKARGKETNTRDREELGWTTTDELRPVTHAHTLTHTPGDSTGPGGQVAAERGASGQEIHLASKLECDRWMRLSAGRRMEGEAYIEREREREGE